MALCPRHIVRQGCPPLPRQSGSALWRVFPGGTHIGKPPTVSTFRLLAQLDMDNFERLLRAWMNAQIGDGEAIETLVFDGKALRVSIA